MLVYLGKIERQGQDEAGRMKQDEAGSRHHAVTPGSSDLNRVCLFSSFLFRRVGVGGLARSTLMDFIELMFREGVDAFRT